MELGVPKLLAVEMDMDSKFYCGHEEDLELYEIGGLHPVNIGDQFKEGRYIVKHKLGFGGFATVWLARDTVQARYVALKIPTAKSSKDLREITIQQYLKKGTIDLHSGIISEFLDDFVIEGPNGQHTCLVLPVSGPCINTLHENMIKLRPDTAQIFARRLAQILAEMHHLGVAYGDLSANNILLGVNDISAWSDEMLYEKLGAPNSADIEPNSLATASNPFAHAPKAYYWSINWHTVDFSILALNVAMIDLNEGVLLRKSTDDSEKTITCCANFEYMAPEYAFGLDTVHTSASDVWALGCIFYLLRTSRSLFGSRRSSIQRAMVGLLGDVPADWRQELQTQAPDLLEELHSDFLDEPEPIQAKIDKIGDWLPWLTMTPDQRRHLVVDIQGGKALEDEDDDMIKAIDDPRPAPPARLSAEEAADFKDLLSKMLVWKPENRISMEQVLVHPWIQKSYVEDMQEEPWISRFHPGWDPQPVMEISLSDDDDGMWDLETDYTEASKDNEEAVEEMPMESLSGDAPEPAAAKAMDIESAVSSYTNKFCVNDKIAPVKQFNAHQEQETAQIPKPQEDAAEMLRVKPYGLIASLVIHTFSGIVGGALAGVLLAYLVKVHVR